jgi:hypothetical protein
LREKRLWEVLQINVVHRIHEPNQRYDVEGLTSERNIRKKEAISLSTPVRTLEGISYRVVEKLKRFAIPYMR